MKILHVASFNGNIGDNASHMGFYWILNRVLKGFSVERVEMRNFYQNYNRRDKKKFDEDFIGYINKHDLCVVGGGGFLDYWVPGSQTGATFDMDPALVAKIKKPTLFTSIGCNPQKTVLDENIHRFKSFLDETNRNKNTQIAVRNDGSVESIKRDFGSEYLENITEILDHGFFYSPAEHSFGLENKKYVAINIVNDQLGMRSSFFSEMENKKEYLLELNKVVEYIIGRLGLSVLFIPHIHSDLKAISEFFEIADDALARQHIMVAPCIQGNSGAEYNFSLYRNSEFVVATRLHANVCSMAMGKKAIGLAVLDRVKYLYRSLGVGDRAIKLGSGFGANIIRALSEEDFSRGTQLSTLKDATMGHYDNALSNL